MELLTDPTLLLVIEQISELSEKAEVSKWDVCDAIYDAFEELPAYTKGLASGLALRMNRSVQHIYDMRNASHLRFKLNLDIQIPFTFYAKMYSMISKYHLEVDDIKYFLTEAYDEGWSVQKMSMEMDDVFNEDPDEKIMRRFARIAKMLRLAWEDAETVNMPEHIRKPLYTCLKLLEEWIGI